MSKIEAGSKVRFTGFKQQDEFDKVGVERLKELYPHVTEGEAVEVLYVNEQGEVTVFWPELKSRSNPGFLYLNEVEIVE